MLSKARSPVLAMALVTVFGGCTAQNTLQQPQSNAVDPTNANYSVMIDSGMMMTPQEAAAAHCDTNTEVCTYPTKVENTLALSTLENGDLAFDVTINGFNGHSCGLQGVAHKTDTPNIWRIEKNNDGEMFKMNIAVGNGAVTLTQDADSNDRAYCGARASLNGTFPISSLK